MLKRLLKRMTAASRRPTDPRTVFLLALSLVSGLSLLITGAKAGSVAALLDHPWVVAWGIALTLGSAISLIGVFWHTATGVMLEQIGSVMVGVASWVYAAAIVLNTGLVGLFPALVIFGWGLCCFWRWAQLQVLVLTAQEVTQK